MAARLVFVKRAVVFVSACALMLAAPAQADIKSFNAAMGAKDYKKAAAEAASTWPTLDKSRKDLAVIAREFGFAAYLADDFVAAKAFSEAAIASGDAVSEDAVLRAGSEVLLRAAELKLSPGVATRAKLMTALTARAASPGLDAMTAVAAELVTDGDFDKAAWADAVASASLAERLSTNGGKAYQAKAFRFALLKNVATYMLTKNGDGHAEVRGLRKRIVQEINAAPSDAAAAPFVPIYWDAAAWEASIRNQLYADGQLSLYQLITLNVFDMREADNRVTDDRAVKLLGLRAPDEPCQTKVDMRREVKYPGSANYQGITGVVILRVDVNAKGESLNPEILAAVPDGRFGKAVMDRIESLRHKPGEKWGPTCSLAREDKVVTFQFAIPRGF